MRYLAMVTMAQAVGPPPPALVEAMGRELGEAFAHGSVLDAGGLWPEGVEFRVQDGRLSRTDGPYAEAREVVGGYAILEARTDDEAVEGARRVAELHLQHWPGWTGTVEIRRITEPEEGPPSA